MVPDAILQDQYQLTIFSGLVSSKDVNKSF